MRLSARKLIILQEVKMIAKVKIASNISLEIEEKNDMETLHVAIALGNPKSKCDECGNTEGLYLTTNKGNGFVFINNKCPKCGARSKLGQYEGGGYFWHDFEKYIPKSGSDSSLA